MSDLYGHRRWRRLRARKLKQHPYCQCPIHEGKRLRADHPLWGGAVVDHHIQHHGDPKLFWSWSNLRSMTKHCHDTGKRSEERGGAGFVGCDDDGIPLAANHHWNT